MPHPEGVDLCRAARVNAFETGATTRSFDMSSIPLDLQRRFEQRWAARFASAAPQKHRPEPHRQQPAAPGKSKRKASVEEFAILRNLVQPSPPTPIGSMLTKHVRLYHWSGFIRPTDMLRLIC